MAEQAPFPRDYRVLRSPEFRRVFARGRSSSDDRVIVYARPRGGDLPTRLGLVVGRKFGPSHLRNHWKRMVREAFRLHHAELPPGHDLLVLPARPEDVADLGGMSRSIVRVAGRSAALYAKLGPRGPRRRR